VISRPIPWDLMLQEVERYIADAEAGIDPDWTGWDSEMTALLLFEVHKILRDDTASDATKIKEALELISHHITFVAQKHAVRCYENGRFDAN